MNYYSHHIGDYLSATAHLTLLEHGVYRRLIDVYYINESALPADPVQVQRLVGARTTEEREAVETILREFFTLTDSGWSQARCDYEIGLCNKNRTNGKKGGRPSGKNNPNETQTEPKDNPIETQPISPPSPHHPITQSKPLSEKSDDTFSRFWNLYPRKAAKKKASDAWRSARINGELESVLTALEVQKASPQWQKDGGQFIPLPATWINGKRWEDEATKPAPQSSILGSYI